MLKDQNGKMDLSKTLKADLNMGAEMDWKMKPALTNMTAAQTMAGLLNSRPQNKKFGKNIGSESIDKMSSKGTKFSVSCKKTEAAPQAVMHLLQAFKVLQLCSKLKNMAAKTWVDNYQNQKSCCYAPVKRIICDNAVAVRSCSANNIKSLDGATTWAGG